LNLEKLDLDGGAREAVADVNNADACWWSGSMRASMSFSVGAMQSPMHWKLETERV
jgi:hypothetical protein